MGNKEIENMIFREKPKEMLLNLYNKESNMNFASNMAKEIDCTYSHCVKILFKLEKAGYLAFLRKGRIKEIYLTKKGKEICEVIEKLKNLF